MGKAAGLLSNLPNFIPTTSSFHPHKRSPREMVSVKALGWTVRILSGGELCNMIMHQACLVRDHGETRTPAGPRNTGVQEGYLYCGPFNTASPGSFFSRPAHASCYGLFIKQHHLHDQVTALSSGLLSPVLTGCLDIC